MNQRTFLGLTHNPFSPPREGFFTGADRKTHLDHLRHLSQWSRRVLVVTGPFGIGKSTLFKELSASLEANTKGARLSGSVVTTEREVLMGLLQGFGVGGELDGHADDLSALICAHADEQESHERVCMVMVDDAHLLEIAALQRLVNLVSESALRVVMFGEATVVPNLDRAAKKSELEWFEIRLTGFPKADVRDYLEWRFRQAHYRGLLPFTDEQLDKIVTRSGGNPSVIDSMANRLLADMESGEIRNQGSSFPARHAALAAVLVLMVGLIYLYVRTEPEELPVIEDVAVVDAAIPPATDPAETSLAHEVEAEDDILPAEVGSDPDPDLDPAAADDGLPEEVAAVVVEPSPEGVEADAPATAGNTEASAATPSAEAETAVLPAADSGIAETTLDESVAVQPDAVEESLANPVQVEESVPETPVSPASEPELASTPAVPDIEDAPVAGGGYRDAAWILAQAADRYTMQILSLSSLDRAVAFINRQDDPGEFALYRMQRDGRTLFVIIYGVFSSRDAAAAAAGSLSGELSSLSPWIRPLSLVQDTVRANPQG